MELTLHVDGGSRGNPGPAAAGVVLYRKGHKSPLLQAGYYLGVVTNNVAEYHGLLRGVTLALEQGATALDVASDSQLLVRQLSGEYRVRSADLLPLYEQALQLLGRLSHWKARHITREQNTRADQLVNRALDARRNILFAGGSPSPAGTRKRASPPAKGAPAPVSAKDSPAHPCWAVRFTAQPPQPCPMSGAHGSVYRLGPDTPAGLCVYAAQAVLSSGVLSGDQTARELRCPRCGVAVQIVPTGDG